MGWQELELRRQPKDLKAEVFRLPRIRSLIVSDGRKELIKPSNEVELKFIELLRRPSMEIVRGSEADRITINNIYNNNKPKFRRVLVEARWDQMPKNIRTTEEVGLRYETFYGDGILEETTFKQERSILFESGEKKVVGHADNTLKQIDNFLKNNKKIVPSSLKLTQREIKDANITVSEMEVSFWLLFSDFLKGIKDLKSRNEYSIRFLNNIAENT